MRLRQRKPSTPSKRLESDFIDLDEERELSFHNSEKRERNTGTYNEINDSQSLPEEEISYEETLTATPSLIDLQVEMLVSKKKVHDIDIEPQSQNQLFLVKFKNRSYYRCKWLNQEELEQYSYQPTATAKKGLSARMAKVKRMRLNEDQHFNPLYLVPDRILNSTDVFSTIHHKKANQIKGTWHETLQIICSKILNFQKNSFPFGTLLIDEIQRVNSNKEERTQTNPIYSIQIIMNRLYFGFYRNYTQVWSDVGKAINKFQQDHKDDSDDYATVGNTIKEATVFLYVQWYILSLQRYYQERLEFQGEPPRQAKLQQLKNVFQNEARFCTNNVFMNEKKVEKPKSEQELQLLNPGELSFVWLDSRIATPFIYRFLQEDDMKQLDLNVEVDRFYLIKWRQLSYAESTWQRESIFGHPEKIQEFRNINKMPNKEIREGLELNLRLHNELQSFYARNREMLQKGRVRKPPQVESAEEKLYLLKRRGERPAKEYKGKDVITFKNYKLLKDFQNQSLNWFIQNWYENRNTILADEMGLGKTIQIIAFLYHLYMHERVLGPFLVLAPLTTLQQWRREIESWTNFNCLLYYDEGKAEGRKICQTYEFHYLHTKRNGDLVESAIPKFNILLTNYENYLKDFDSLKDIAFQHIVVDEAHKMKNVRTNLSQALRSLPCQRKTLLTGTPVQNNTKELWSLLNYIEPKHFADQESFTRQYGSLNTEAEVGKLKRMLKPFLLRRVKEDVEKLIPRLSQIIIDVEMTKLQKTIYKSILEKNKGDIIRGLATANFNNIAIQFRKCCNHPFLISQQLQKQILADCHNQRQITEKFQSVSGKMILLSKLLSKFRQQRKKTLVFSQFVIMLDLLEDFLDRKGYKCQVLHGGITASNRHRAITRFCEDGEIDVFLISTKAGGVGINLTAATEIIIFDSDWNPQNDIQATARAHRIGQKNEVTVYRLITSNSYESEMFQIAARKLGMDKAIFNGDYFKSSKNAAGAEFEQAMSKAEIETLLKKGVLGFLENAGSEEDFFKQDIDQILEKNARKVQYSLTGQQNYSYTKSKFVGETSSSGLDINSSNFWEVALKDIESPIQKLSKKFQSTTGLQDMGKQQGLMLETMKAVSDFVRMRVAGSAFNVQDERILYKLLGRISQSRIFNRDYRQIADKLVEEIEKPSRRFKVTAQEIRAVRGITLIQDTDHNEEEQEEEEEENVSAKDRQSEIDESQKRIQAKKVKKTTIEPQQPTSKSEQEEISRLRADYEKTCCVCLKPKCSIFCGGVCKRSFHKLCWRRFMNNDRSIPSAIQLAEMGMDFKDWISQIDRNKICETCETEENICICSICGQEGTLDEYQKNDKSMAKCKREDCDRFYHLNCLSQSEEFGWLVIQGNRRNGVQGIHIDRLTCPTHLCFCCGLRISKSKWLKMHSCVKCCRTYHPKCLSQAKNYIHLNDTYYICQGHLERTALAALEREYKLINSDRKNIKELKKMEKSYKAKRIEKMRVEKQTDEELPYSYQDFNLEEISEFDYSNYEKLWCRYCGSRYAQAFCEGPWGQKTLCLHHSRLWKKGKLDLSIYPEQPIHPLSRKETELKYLNKLAKDKNMVPLQLLQHLRSMRTISSFSE